MARHAHMLAHAHKHKARQQPSHVTHFVSIHLADAAGISARTGIPAEVILAQFALETNWVEQ